jgi:hypothetical protein
VESKLLRAQLMRVEIRHLRARAALAVASQAAARGNGSEARRMRQDAIANAEVIERDDVAPAMPMAAAIRAGAAGDRQDDAIAHLERARSGFHAAGMTLYAHAVSARLGTRRGGTEGTRLREEAHLWMTSSGIDDPESMIAMLLPGV